MNSFEDAMKAYSDIFGSKDQAKEDAYKNHVKLGVMRNHVLDAIRQLQGFDTGQLVALGMGEAAASVRAALKHLQEALK